MKYFIQINKKPLPMILALGILFGSITTGFGKKIKNNELPAETSSSSADTDTYKSNPLTFLGGIGLAYLMVKTFNYFYPEAPKPQAINSTLPVTNEAINNNNNNNNNNAVINIDNNNLAAQANIQELNQQQIQNQRATDLNQLSNNGIVTRARNQREREIREQQRIREQNRIEQIQNQMAQIESNQRATDLDQLSNNGIVTRARNQREREIRERRELNARLEELLENIDQEKKDYEKKFSPKNITNQNDLRIKQALLLEKIKKQELLKQQELIKKQQNLDFITEKIMEKSRNTKKEHTIPQGKPLNFNNNTSLKTLSTGYILPKLRTVLPKFFNSAAN